MGEEPTKDQREHTDDADEHEHQPEAEATDLAPDEAEQSGIAGGMRKSGGDPY